MTPRGDFLPCIPVAEELGAHELYQDVRRVKGWICKAAGHKGRCKLARRELETICTGEEALHLFLHLFQWCCLHEEIEINIFVNQNS